MEGESFESFTARERTRLEAEREIIRTRQAEFDRELDRIDREMHAITAYERAKSGAPMARQGRGGGGQRSGGGQPRGRKGSKREDLLNVIRSANGMSRGEILEKMGLKGNKSGEMSVSNALTSLTKNGQVRREGGKYSVAG